MLPVHPALQLKVHFCQMALPTPAAAPPPTASPAESRSRFTHSNPVLWKALSHQATSTLEDIGTGWPTKLILAKVLFMIVFAQGNKTSHANNTKINWKYKHLKRLMRLPLDKLNKEITTISVNNSLCPPQIYNNSVKEKKVCCVAFTPYSARKRLTTSQTHWTRQSVGLVQILLHFNYASHMSQTLTTYYPTCINTIND